MFADWIRKRPYLSVMLLLGVVWGVVLAWTELAGLRLAGLGDLAATLLLLGSNFLIYRRLSLGDRAANLLWGFTVFFALTSGSVVLSYLAATSDRPFADPLLSHADAALGFDWLTWFHFVQTRPVLHNILTTAYISMVAQIAICLVALPLSGMAARNRELLACFAIALVPTIILFAFFPAESAWVYYKVEPGKVPEFLRALNALRGGALPVIDLQRLDGLVTFPSFHTAAAVLLIYVSRGTRYLFLSFVWNALMIVSTLTAGGHYLVDIIGGVIVALCSITLVRAIELRTLFIRAANS